MVASSDEATTVRIDLGCGAAKREGYVGVDSVDAPGVDHVLDLTADPLPLPDDSVDEVFSAHFLEHIATPDHVFNEVGRVCRDGALIEFWTPHAFSNEAFVYGHSSFLTETMWTQLCVSHGDMFTGMLRGRWLLHSITYVIPPEIRADLERNNVTLDFAVRYLKNIVEEFGVQMEYRNDLTVSPVLPQRYWSDTRFGERHDLTATQRTARDELTARTIARALIPSRLRPFARRIATLIGLDR